MAGGPADLTLAPAASAGIRSALCKLASPQVKAIGRGARGRTRIDAKWLTGCLMVAVVPSLVIGTASKLPANIIIAMQVCEIYSQWLLREIKTVPLEHKASTERFDDYIDRRPPGPNKIRASEPARQSVASCTVDLDMHATDLLPVKTDLEW